MKILVYGAGVIGSYLAHVLCANNHDVTLLARGDWKKELEINGLTIYHYLQKKTTKDHPKIVSEVKAGEQYDAVFAVMQYQQMQNILDNLSEINTPVVVLVGNNMSASEMEQYIHQHSKNPKEVYFGFGSIGGHREKDRVVSVRKGNHNFILGSLYGEKQEETMSFFYKIFGSKYQPKYINNMNAWLKCHLALILPIAYLSYSLKCNLRKSTSMQRRFIMDSVLEGYQLIKELGYPIKPDGDELYFQPGIKRNIMSLIVLLMAKTKIGDLAATDHCKAAVSEIEALDMAFSELRRQASNFHMPHWDKLKMDMPKWEELKVTYSKG